MSNVKLTDFNSDQLQVLVSAIELMREEKKKGFFVDHSEDDINLVRTQVLTAIGFRENITATLSN